MLFHAIADSKKDKTKRTKYLVPGHKVRILDVARRVGGHPWLRALCALVS